MAGIILPQVEFYMMRHGQTPENEQGIIAGGDVDTILTKLGEEQADAVAPIIAALEKKPGMAFHSPLVRSANTAHRAMQQLPPGTVELVPVPDLHEKKWGAWAGIKVEEAKRRSAWGLTPPGGESREVYQTRMNTALAGCLTMAQKAGKVPLISTHRGNLVAFGANYGKDMDFKDENCVLYHMVPRVDREFPWSISKVGLEKGKITETPVMLASIRRNSANGEEKRGR